MDQNFWGHETSDLMADLWPMVKGFLIVVAVAAAVLVVGSVLLMMVELHLLRVELQELRSVHYARSAMIRHDIALLQHIVETRFGVTWHTWMPAATLGPEWTVFYPIATIACTTITCRRWLRSGTSQGSAWAPQFQPLLGTRLPFHSSPQPHRSLQQQLIHGCVFVPLGGGGRAFRDEGAYETAI